MKRNLLFGIAAALFAAAGCSHGTDAGSDEEWAQLREAAKNRPRHAIYENDGDDCWAFPGSLEKSIDNYLSLRTSYLNTTKVTTISYTPTENGFGHVSLQMKNADQLLFRSPDGSPAVNLTPWLFEHGTDTLTEQIKYAHANNLEIFADIRTNDVHDDTDRPDKPSPLFSTFKRSHPELLCGAWTKRPPYGSWSSFDYGQKEFQDFFLAHVCEIIEKYDIDGVNFDFNRRMVLFKRVAWGGTATDADRKIRTDLMRGVKNAAEKHGRRRNRPVLISVRVPDSVEYCRAVGIDLERWLAEGLIDMVIAGGDFRLNTWEYTAKLAKKYGAKCYASIDLPQFGRVLGRLDRYDFCTYHARSAAAFAAGMDGCFYFNLFNRGTSHALMLPKEDLKLLDKRYHITDRHFTGPGDYLKGGDRFCNVEKLHPMDPPRVMKSGERSRFVIEIGDDFDALKREGVAYTVRAVVAGFAADPGKLLFDTGTGPWKYSGSFGRFHYFDAPDGALKCGLNDLTIEAGGSGDAGLAAQTILKGDELLVGGKQPPWRRLFDRSDAENSEKIIDGAYRIIDSGKGCSNLIYPLPHTDYPLRFGFDLKVDAASDDRAVICRFADGKHVEIIAFTADEIKLLYAGTSVKFDTRDRFHRYDGVVEEGRLRLLADGKELLTAPLVMKVGDPRGELAGFSWEIPYMHSRSLLIGSLSDPGTSVSHWKNLQLFHPAGTLLLEDCAIEVTFPKKR